MTEEDNKQICSTTLFIHILSSTYKWTIQLIHINTYKSTKLCFNTATLLLYALLLLPSILNFFSFFSFLCFSPYITLITSTSQNPTLTENKTDLTTLILTLSYWHLGSRHSLLRIKSLLMITKTLQMLLFNAYSFKWLTL